MQLSRRDALKLGVLGSAALVLPVERVARTALAQAPRLTTLPPKYTRLLSIPPVLVPQVKTLADGRVVDYYALTAREALVDALGSGYPKTKIFGYNGITPGPTIQATKGREVVMRVANALPDQHPTLFYRTGLSTHLHGSPSLPQFDGYASDVTFSGYAKYYLYPNFEVARTLWYHDHGVHVTAKNAYMGLAAQYHLFDPHERSLPLPKGPYDIPLTIRDAIFGVDGSLLYDDDDESSVMGDVILVNGRAWPRLRVEKRKYRFRLLNASISRSYKLALSTGTMTVIAGNLSIVAMYVLTRTNGPPLGPHAGVPEDPELLGMATVAAELGAVVLLLGLLEERTRRAVTTALLLVGVAAWTLRATGVLL